MKVSTTEFSGFNRVINGTSDVDVVRIVMGDHGEARTIDLSDMDIRKIDGSTYTISNPLLASTVELKNFDPKIDMIRTTDGDFTLQEIMDHGPNAPFYKQAQITKDLIEK